MNLFQHNKDLDFISIGDITVDAFIRLKEAQIERDENGNKMRLSLSCGDKVP